MNAPVSDPAARLAELEAENARLRAANAVLVNGYRDIRALIARRAEFERPFDLLVEIGVVEQNAITEAMHPADGQGDGVRVISREEASAALQLAGDALHARALKRAGDLMDTDDPAGIEELRRLGEAIERYEDLRWPIGKDAEGKAPRGTISIQWMLDGHDCENCGYSYAEGAAVDLDGEPLLELIPHAHCFDGSSWAADVVYARILEALGYKVESTQAETGPDGDEGFSEY